MATKKIASFGGHTARVGALAWNADLLSSGSRDRNIIQRDIRSSTGSDAVKKLTGHRQEVSQHGNTALYLQHLHSLIYCNLSTLITVYDGFTHSQLLCLIRDSRGSLSHHRPSRLLCLIRDPLGCSVSSETLSAALSHQRPPRLLYLIRDPRGSLFSSTFRIQFCTHSPAFVLLYPHLLSITPPANNYLWLFLLHVGVPFIGLWSEVVT